MAKRHRLALALGGGGVRGLANIGVLRAMEDGDLVPDIVTGTSMGAIVGSVYAETKDAAKTEDIIREYLGNEEFIKKARKFSMSSEFDRGFLDTISEKAKKGYFFYRFLMRKSVISPEAFFSQMDHIIPDKRFDDLEIPFACVALDIVSGCPESLHSGAVQTAVRASSSVPGVLPPVEIGSGRYVDGGWVETVPVSAARLLGADFVIGVDVSREIMPIDFESQIKNSMDILSRSDDIARSMMNTYRTMDANFVIRPSVGNADWSDFDNIDFYISAGLKAGQDAIVVLKRAKRFKKFKSALWKRR
ncbi:MAG: patatin-like phospholipase family protein [Thermodesulfobacteriota bacterium]|nr:patatin-like phospholipase family protein [Thermodesulfobacteriota bacterium]